MSEIDEAAALGSIVTTGFNSLFNRSEAKHQRNFQKRMAHNRIQWAAKDMEKAGLNRILALGDPAPDDRDWETEN